MSFINLDSTKGKYKLGSNSYELKNISNANVDEFPNSFNMDFPITPQRIKNITLKSLILPVSFTNLRMNSFNNHLTVVNDELTPTLTCKIVLPTNQYDDINALIILMNNQLIASSMSDFVFSIDSGTKKMKLVFTPNPISGSVFILDSPLANMLGFRSNLSPTKGTIIAKAMYNLNDTYIQMIINGDLIKTMSNFDNTKSGFIIPILGDFNSIIYLTDKRDLITQTIEYNSKQEINNLTVQFVDSNGYSLNSMGGHFSCQLEINR